MNIRREKTRRERIEMEIKKWNKKVESQKCGIININNNNNSSNVSRGVIDNNVSVSNNNNDSEVCYDVVKLDEYKKDSNNIKGENNNNNSNSNNNTTILKHNVNEDYNNNNITQTFICYICQRKFPSEEKLKLHESMSELHKANLEKQKKETLS
jgi:hypothetical protein